MPGGDQHIRIGRDLFAFLISLESLFKIAFQIIGQTEMVEDIGLQSRGRNIPCIRQAVRLDLIGLSLYQLCRFLKISRRIIKAPQRQIPMAAVPTGT